MYMTIRELGRRVHVTTVLQATKRSVSYAYPYLREWDVIFFHRGMNFGVLFVRLCFGVVPLWGLLIHRVIQFRV